MDGTEFTWKKEMEVPAFAADFRGKIKFYYLCDWLFDAASEHARSLGWGYGDLKKQKRYWVLSRLHVQMQHYPGMHEHITLETWPRGISGAFALRDFRLSVRDAGVCLATTAWLILDARNGRPVRINEFSEIHDYDTGKYAIKEVPGKLPPVEDPDQSLQVPVRYSDLDVNDHVNSAKYIEWIQDSFDKKAYLNRQIGDFMINFLSEGRFGDVIRLERMPGKDPACENYFEAKKHPERRPVFRAFVRWK